MISVALSVVAVMVAGVGFLVAVGAHRRMARGPGSSSGSSSARGQHAASPPPRARHARETEQGGPDEGAPDPYEVAPRPVGRYSGDLHEVDPRALRDLAIIRYDALQEMSGQLSFSLALLNSDGDGVVLSSINGRAETRTYAKTVVGGQGAQELSPEEEEAIRLARTGQGPAEHAQVTAKPKITGQTGAPGAAIFSQIS
ncbi:MAG TPA: DUF4446 family protein [Trebonia sp.]|nr:DUF4446 family protein [Trebonia sp.]